MVIPNVSLVKCNFRTHYKVSSILIEWLISEVTPELQWLLPVIYVTTINMSFFEIMLSYHFSLEAVLQDVAKNNPTKKELDAEIQVTLKDMPAC